MASRKELLVIVLDVGEHMHPHVEQAGQVLFNCALSKLLFQPNHEIAVIYYGTTDTKNAVHDEMAASGDDTQYCNIAVQQPLQTPNLQYLTTLVSIPRGKGPSDFLDALVVALDLTIRAVQERTLGGYNKRIIMVSTFAAQAKEMDADFRADMVKNMQDLGVKLDALCIEPGNPGGTQSANEQVLHELLTEVRGQLHTFEQASELTSYFKARDYTTNPTYRGDLTIGKSIVIKVRVFKKTGKETLPSLKMYSDKAQDQPSASHEVIRDTEYKLVSDPDTIVPVEEKVSAYRYGKQFVPLSKEDADALAYHPERGFQVLGFPEAHAIPRQHFIKDASIVVPDFASKESCRALSALTQALHNNGKVALVRGVLRARSNLFMGVLTPQLGSARRPDTLVLNYLPFLEDVRDYFFSPLLHAPEQLQPTPQQLKAAVKFVDALSLGGKDGAVQEKLQPERTVNPTLQRFFTTLGHKALDPEAPVADVDALVSKTFAMQVKALPEDAQNAVEKLRAAFPITEVQKKPQAAEEAALSEAAPETRFAANRDALFEAEGGIPGSRVQHVGTITPVEDFEALVAAGNLQQAISEMGGVIDELVTSSVGDRLYEKGLQCVGAVRKACVAGQHHEPFNSLLNILCTKYEYHSERKGFWLKVVDAGITLVNSSENPSSDVSPEQAAQFLRLHTPGAGATEVKAEAAMHEEEDEFAGIE